VPAASIAGELSINAADGKIWITNAAATSQILVSSLNRSDHTGTLAVASGGTGATSANAAANAILPSQTSNSGKYLTTNGTDTSWGTVSSGSTLPAGSMQMFAGAITQSASAGVVTTTAPSGGWLLCNGDIISRTTYSALFTAIGTTFGAGDGSTTFALPDMRGRVPSAVGTGTYAGATARTLGGTVGTESHTVSSSNITQFSTGAMSANENHTHGSGATGFWVYNSGLGATIAGGSTYNASAGGSANTASTNLAHTHTVGTASPTAISNFQPSIGLNFIIKT
jgi:microcystin-dependent protein